MKPAVQRDTPTSEIFNVELEPFEQLVYSRQYEAAGKSLLNILNLLRNGGTFVGHPLDPATHGPLYTRLAAAITALLADPGFMLSREGFDRICASHWVMESVFVASAFGNSDHLAQLLASNPMEMDKAKLNFGSVSNLAKFVAVYCLGSDVAMRFEQAFKPAPHLMLSSWLGLLAHGEALTPKSHERREELNGLHELFAGVDLPDLLLPALSDVYMYSSYAVREDKHNIKRTLNTLCSKMLYRKVDQLSKVTTRRDKTLERPTVVVCLDWFNSFHAMFRCYAPSIRQLRKRFKLVGFGRLGEVDDVAMREFDVFEVLDVDKGIALDTIVQRILAQEPAIVYYPSVGMSPWWVALSSVRLAPIQCFSPGHPATTASEVMDYVLLDEGSPGKAELFSERRIILPDRSVRLALRDDTVMPPLRDSVDRTHEIVAGSPVRFAVPAMWCKLNAPFIAALQKIKAKIEGLKGNGRKVEFHFFPNQIGLGLFSTTKQLNAALPGSVAWPRTAYPQYLAWLAACDVHLSTFPFGGTNSNIDAFMLGIPVVTKYGYEPHEQFDAAMLRRVGMQELVCADEEAYVNLAVSLAHDDSYRMQLSAKLRAVDLDAEFYSDPPPEAANAFLQAFEAMYDHHEDIQKMDDRTVWLSKELPWTTK